MTTGESDDASGIGPSDPVEFGLLRVRWGDRRDETTAPLCTGMGAAATATES